MKKILSCAIIIINLFVMSACGETKLSGTWDVNDGEMTIEFIDDEKCLLDGDQFNYSILENNRIHFSSVWDEFTCTYEIIDKSNKKMTIDEE